MEEVDQLMQQEGYDVMAAAFEVYNEQGCGLAEEVYQESLELELAVRSIPFSAKEELAVYYKGQQLKKKYLPDLVIFGGIVVELKAVKHLLPEHEAQLMNYLRITRSKVGYLINFGPPGKVEWKRMIVGS